MSFQCPNCAFEILTHGSCLEAHDPTFIHSGFIALKRLLDLENAVSKGLLHHVMDGRNGIMPLRLANWRRQGSTRCLRNNARLAQHHQRRPCVGSQDANTCRSSGSGLAALGHTKYGLGRLVDSAVENAGGGASPVVPVWGDLA